MPSLSHLSTRAVLSPLAWPCGPHQPAKPSSDHLDRLLGGLPPLPARSLLAHFRSMWTPSLPPSSMTFLPHALPSTPSQPSQALGKKEERKGWGRWRKGKNKGTNCVFNPTALSLETWKVSSFSCVWNCLDSTPLGMHLRVTLQVTQPKIHFRSNFLLPSRSISLANFSKGPSGHLWHLPTTPTELVLPKFTEGHCKSPHPWAFL